MPCKLNSIENLTTKPLSFHYNQTAAGQGQGQGQVKNMCVAYADPAVSNSSATLYYSVVSCSNL